MTTPNVPPPGETPAVAVHRIVQSATRQIDQTAGVRPVNRPVHLQQLNAVLRLAVVQAAQAERTDPSVSDRDAELWRLREPGYLRAICDHPVARPNAALVLLPVALAWLVLGIAEFRYAQHADTKEAFFAHWI